ncbi:coiled-coil domain-containing protein 93 isoform X1 [Cucumis sativus]|uniref:coiled-coil domain-containing protein 93 isoform X1 n=1 Tax=Cucumis sativus TaxID=3659 RepID=UPI0012F4EB9D|nr:coiled-coil domain-containing protein 93 isoform X1 [Cucumis sativus]
MFTTSSGGSRQWSLDGFKGGHGRTCQYFIFLSFEVYSGIYCRFRLEFLRILMIMNKSYQNNQKKVAMVKDLQLLRDRVDKADANVVQNLKSCLKTLEDLGKQESEFMSTCNSKRSELQDEIIELGGRLTEDHECLNFFDSLDDLISASEEELDSVKKALALSVRETLALKRLLDDVPTQTELIQYERRFSELYTNIQDKLRQTRRYYATYNALLEIKDLMLKETSLLNSISSQFQDAIASSASKMKLIDSMVGILKGIQQKLNKVHLSHQEEQQVCNALKEKYAAATAEQRRCYTLLKAFQEECAKNEKLRTQNFV